MSTRGDRPGEAADPASRSALARVATNLRRLRHARGWTQEEAARRCGDMAAQYFQLIEREGVNVTVSTLSRLAQGLGVDIVDLLAPGEPLPPRVAGRPRKRRTSAEGEGATSVQALQPNEPQPEKAAPGIEGTETKPLRED